MSEESVATLLLEGKRVLVTRTSDQASVFSEQLRALGAIPVEFPTIRIEPPDDWSVLDAALHKLYGGSEGAEPFYDWLIFTSANGVTICCERLRTLGYEPQTLRGVRVATIGPATAAALMSYGLRTDLAPDEYIAESVATALIEDVQRRGASLNGQHILLACAAEARKVLVTELEQAGTRVDEVAAYYTHTVSYDDGQGRVILDMLCKRQLDILTFTSSSTVRNFNVWLQSCIQNDELLKPQKLLSYTTIACIGPITAQTARDLGLRVDIEAKEFTIDGLIKAIVQHEGKP